MATTIITAQPTTTILAPINMQEPPREWSSGLCSCFDDLPSCLLAFFCPCFMECWVASAADECVLLPACFPAATVAIRTKIRAKHNIRGSICNDCLLYALCPCCASAQTKRELDAIKEGRAT